MLVLLNCSTYFCHGDSNCVRLFVSIFFRWRFDKREFQMYTYICWYKPNEPYIPNTLSPHPHTLHTHIRTDKMQDKQQLKSRTDSRSIRQSHQSPKLPIALSTPKRDSVSRTQRYERELGYKWGSKHGYDEPRTQQRYRLPFVIHTKFSHRITPSSYRHS